MSSTVGVVLVACGGVLSGSFTVPMQFCSGWPWEACWLVYSIVGLLIVPVATALISFPLAFEALSRAPHHSIALTVGFGFLWGVGSILFGSAVKMVGSSLAFSIVLGSCAAFGALFPLVILHPDEISSSVGYHTFAGLAIIVVALTCIARAGMQKDESVAEVDNQSPSDNSRSSLHEQQVNTAAPLARGVCVCLLSGLFSAALNFSLAFAGSIRASAAALQSSDFGATSLVWALAVGCGGFVANAGFCMFLLFKNSTLRKFCVARQQVAIILSESGDYVEFDSVSSSTKTSEINVRRTAKNVFCCCSMGCLWIGGYFLYGAGCSVMGPAAAVVAWPINLCASVATANVCAWLSGEWKHTSQQTRMFLLLGLLLLFAAASVMAQ